MRFLADMGISPTIVRRLRELAHDVVHLRDEGLERLPDAAVFAKAEQESRIVLTFDLDFGEIAAHTRNPQTSVIVFRLRNTRVDHVSARLEDVLNRFEGHIGPGQVVTVEESRHRLRRFPFTPE